MDRYWNWLRGGIALAAIAVIAVVLVKPIGVSTQYVITNGIAWNLFDDGVVIKETDESGKTHYSSENAYLAKSNGKYAKSVDNPINYGYLFVLAMIGGAFIAAKSSNSKPSAEESGSPEIWSERFGANSKSKRYLVAFLGGFLVLFGARLAGGCTSGHMVSGMMQTSLSGYLFALGVFITAVPAALLLYRRGAAQQS